MARYVATVRSPLSAQKAFAMVADMSRFAEWDPGVVAACQVSGSTPGPDAAWDLTLARPPKMRLRYQVLEYAEGERIVVEARHRLLHSHDLITVEPDGDGSRVTYDAELFLSGPLAVFDGLLARGFQGVGDRAATGLAAFLEASGWERATDTDMSHSSKPATT